MAGEMNLDSEKLYSEQSNENSGYNIDDHGSKNNVKTFPSVQSSAKNCKDRDEARKYKLHRQTTKGRP